MADLSKITLPNGSTYDLKDTTARAMAGFYIGTCVTAAGTKDKVVTLNDATGFKLKAGVVVAVKFTYTNTYSSSTTNPITLNVNSTGAKNIWYGATHSGAGNTGTFVRIYGYAGRYTYYVYDGTYWVWLNYGVEDDTNYHMPSCITGAGTAAKAVYCTYYTLKEDSYIPILIQNTNTAASALTLNVNSQGAKPIYINGSASSSSNHTLPRGTYIVFYDGSKYYFRTDGKLPADISGDSATVNGHSVASDVPNDLNERIKDSAGDINLSSLYTFYYGTSEPHIAQGMTVVDKELIYAITYNNGTNEVAKIVSRDIETGEVLRQSSNLTIGHCNSLEYHDGIIYVSDTDGYWKVNFSTLALSGSKVTLNLPSTTSVVVSLFFVDDEMCILYGITTEKTPIYSVSSSGNLTLKLELSPACPIGIQNCKYHDGYYYVLTNSPHGIYIYDSEGNLSSSNVLPFTADGITYNEIEDIGFYDNNLIMNFHVDDLSYGLVQIASAKYDGSTIALQRNAARNPPTVGSAGQTIYVDVNTTGYFHNGSAGAPFKTIYEAINALRFTCGGKGVIYLAPGAYTGVRLYDIDAVIEKNPDKSGTVSISNFFIRNSRITINGCTLTIPDVIEFLYSNVILHNCTFTTTASSKLSLYGTHLLVNNSISFECYVAPDSSLQVNADTAGYINNLGHAPNTYRRSVSLYPNRSTQIVYTANVPAMMSFLFATKYGEMSATISPCNLARGNPITASITYYNGSTTEITFLPQFRVFKENSSDAYYKIVYYDCRVIERTISSGAMTYRQYISDTDSSKSDAATSNYLRLVGITIVM